MNEPKETEVCRYTKDKGLFYFRECSTGDDSELMDGGGWEYCPYCGKPIEFVGRGDE